MKYKFFTIPVYDFTEAEKELKRSCPYPFFSMWQKESGLVVCQ